MIVVNKNMKRILKVLSNMQGKIVVGECSEGIFFNYIDKNVDITIYKSNSINKYEIEQYYEEYSKKIYFTTQSSVINYLRNNI